MGDNLDAVLPPDKLRETSPWTISLFGDWRFRLTHGEISGGHFVASLSDQLGLKASSTQTPNNPANAFDGRPDTRWCADGATFPQWIQARLDRPQRVTAVEIAWEKPTASYKYQIQGSDDGDRWHTILDRSSEPGTGDRVLTIPSGGVVTRYVRLLVIDASPGSWASVRELKIHYQLGGTDVVWRPSKPKPVTPSHADDFVATTFADEKWDHLSVPSNWEMAGYSIPTYNKVDDSVGLYRRWIDVPKFWAGKKIFWRSDGVLDGAEVFVNGKRAGYHESGYTSFDIDLTGLIEPGKRNLIAVRVCKTTPSVEAETGDYQCMGGIFRDTRLIAVPKTYAADLTVRTPLTNDYRDANLQTSLRIAGSAGQSVRVGGYVVDAATHKRIANLNIQPVTLNAQGNAVVNSVQIVSGPKLWSAESPSLYYLVLELRSGGKVLERVEQRFGFRQVEIKNDIVLWNGTPIKCTGICRHDFWPDKGFALGEPEWTKDLTLMKATNINAIRTSHYNHAARFLELCDERGFYILDEVPFCWVDDLVKDPKFAPALLQRAEETVARDKNRACVLAWSLGNENPIGIDTQMVHDLVSRQDPTRPSFASGGGPDNVKGQELFDTHYPSPESIQRYLDKYSRVAPEVITEHPHTFFSRQTQTYDPGASDTWSEGLIATWNLLWKSPTILGSFIWEWQSQGIADKYADHLTDFYYGLDHMRQENNKGIMSAFRKPKTEQWIVKMVYSPVQVPTRMLRIENGYCLVPVVNRFAFTDLSQMSVKWTAWKSGTPLGSGLTKIECPPGQTTIAKIAALKGVNQLMLTFDRPDGTNITLARLETEDAPKPEAPAAIGTADALSVRDRATSLEVSSRSQTIRFDKKTGTMDEWTVNGKSRLQGSGPILNLGQASTASGQGYYRASQFPSTDHATVVSKQDADGTVEVTTQAQVYPGDGSSDMLGVLSVDYAIHPNAEIAVRYRLTWNAPDIRLWEFGMCIPVNSASDRESWYRDSYFSAYPAGHLGVPVGTATSEDVSFRASKRSLWFMTLTDGNGVGVALIHSASPLIGRANKDAAGATLYASREVAAAGPDDLSWSWFHAHDIYAKRSQALDGDFVLRAIGPNN
jgi:beta-galactosidase